MEPTIIIGGDTEGIHTKDIAKTVRRLEQGSQYRDLSTVCIIPTRGLIPMRIVEAWWSLMNPMNNRFIRLAVAGFEVGAAYETAVETVMNHEQLSKWKFILTLEEDNAPPPDGLLKLYESICQCRKLCHTEPAIVGGLYFTKGEGGQPMIYGNPKLPLAFQPQVPIPNAIQECNGLGMGFSLFRMDLFREIERPWFKTVQEFVPGQGASAGTQDLYFMGKVREKGYRIASDNRVRVGHYDHESGVMY